MDQEEIKKQSDEEQDQQLLQELGLPERVYYELKEAFTLFEKTGEGVITPEDLGKVLRAVGQNPSQEDITECQQIYRVDENGTIPFAEFMRAVKNYKFRSEEEQEDDLSQAFAVFDRDGDNTISLQELRDTLLSLGEKMSEEEVEDLFSLIENNNNVKKIQYKEFVRPLTQVTPPKTSSSSTQQQSPSPVVTNGV